MGQEYGIDLSSLNFCSFDRIGKKQMQASLDDIVDQSNGERTDSVLLDGWAPEQVVKGCKGASAASAASKPAAAASRLAEAQDAAKPAAKPVPLSAPLASPASSTGPTGRRPQTSSSSSSACAIL